jgi:hypothetical protein
MYLVLIYRLMPDNRTNTIAVVTPFLNVLQFSRRKKGSDRLG